MQTCPFYSTLFIIALASLSQLLYWGVHHTDMCMTFFSYTPKDVITMLEKHNIYYKNCKCDIILQCTVEDIFLLHTPLDRISAACETHQRGPMGPLCKPTHPHQAVFDRILQ